MCTYETTTSIFIHIIWTQYYKQCDKEHLYTCIPHYWHMLWKNISTKLHIDVPLHFNCSLHINPKLLHTSIKINKLQHLSYYCKISGSHKHAFQMLHISYMPYYVICICGENLSLYMPAMNSLVSTMWQGVMYTDDSDAHVNNNDNAAQLH